jgi:hypothetical protein
MSNQQEKTWAARKHALRYVKGTTHLGIDFRQDETEDDLPIAYSDSDWGGPLTGDKRSVTGYVFKWKGAPVSWKSQRQTSVAFKSSNEAE